MGDGGVQVVGDQLPGREVHRDGQGRAVAGLAHPLRGLPARGLEDCGSDRNDEAVVLGDREKLRRGEHAVLPVLPPQQCFEPGDLGVFEAHDRLVVDAKLAAIHGVADRRPQDRFVERPADRLTPFLHTGHSPASRPVDRGCASRSERQGVRGGR